jgi:hypothetical protein
MQPKCTEMKLRIWAQLERHFSAMFRRLVLRERNVFEAEAMGTTLFCVLSVLLLVAVGVDINHGAIQLVFVASSALGF